MPSRREEHRGEGELDRRRETLLQLVGHRATGCDARSQVAARRRLHVVPVLDVNRLVEPVVALDLGDRLGGRALAEQRLGRPARKRSDPDEDEEGEPEQDRDEKQQPADDEFEASVRRAAAGSHPYFPIETVENGSSETGLGT